MKYETTKLVLQNCFRKVGFTARKKTLWRDFGEIAVLTVVRKGFGSQVNVDIGFWIKAINPNVVHKVEHCHVYMRLERLLVDVRETYLTATDCGDANQQAAFEEFERYFRKSFIAIVAELATNVGLATALVEGRLKHSLILKEARAFLETVTLH